MYSFINALPVDKESHTYKFDRQLWMSQGDVDTVQMIADNLLLQFPFVNQPDGAEMIYFSDQYIYKRDELLKEVLSVPFDFVAPISYKMAWQPGTSVIFLYSEGAMGMDGSAFILNADTGHICELRFVGWASQARWSSDGRYLAMGRVTNSYPGVLALLDTVTGTLITLRGTPREIEGQLFVYDFVWAPDDHQLLAIGSIQPQNSETNPHGLYLVDISTGQSVHVLPEHKMSFVSQYDSAFAWSPDASKLTIHCPTPSTDQICIIPVQKSK
jgi:hypothetical protein